MQTYSTICWTPILVAGIPKAKMAEHHCIQWVCVCVYALNVSLWLARQLKYYHVACYLGNTTVERDMNNNTSDVLSR